MYQKNTKSGNHISRDWNRLKEEQEAKSEKAAFTNNVEKQNKIN